MSPLITSFLRLSSLLLVFPVCHAAATTVPAVKLSGSVVAEAWANPMGGIESDHWFVAGADLVAERDLPSGLLYAHLRAVENGRGDGAFADAMGGYHPVSNTFASDQLRVYNLYYRHTPANAGWQLKLGQLALDDDFAVSAGGAHFLNAAFGALPSLTGTPLRADRGGAAFPIYSVAAPGLWFERQLSEAVTWQVAAYHGGPGLDRRGNHGFRWAGASHSGVVAATEWVVSHRLGRRPATSRFGVSAHSGSFDDLDAAARGHSDVHVRGLWSAYATHDIALLGEDLDAPRLQGFTRVGAAPQQDRAAISYYADIGLVSHGPLPGRPRDIAGAGVSSSRFGRGFRSTQATARTETLIEVLYTLAATHRLAVTADVQWVFNAVRRPEFGDRGTVTVLGLRTRYAW